MSYNERLSYILSSENKHSNFPRNTARKKNSDEESNRASQLRPNPASKILHNP
jgi:hypothetical protein